MDENIIDTALIACVLMGTANIATMVKCATRNKQRELSKTAKRWLRIISFVCVLLAVSSVISSVANYSLIGQYTYPSYGNYHDLESGRMCVGSLTFGFIFLGLAFYCFFFKNSRSRFVVKFFKALLLFFMVFLYWLPVAFYPDMIGIYVFNICFIILNIAFFNSSKDNADSVSNEKIMTPTSELCDSVTENNVTITAINSTNNETVENKNLTPADTVSELPTVAIERQYNFCRFCGHKLIAGDKFCRNCGKRIS